MNQISFEQLSNTPLYLDAIYYSLYCKCNENLANYKKSDLEIMNIRLNEIYNTYYHVEMPDDIMNEYNELYPWAILLIPMVLTVNA